MSWSKIAYPESAKKLHCIYYYYTLKQFNFVSYYSFYIMAIIFVCFSLLNSLREAYPQQYYNSEVVPSYESYDLGGAQGVEEEPEIVLPGEEEAYPRYNSEWQNTQKYCIPLKLYNDQI
jgi:hypothetical protein